MINAVNEQFSRFVSFARERVQAGKEKAIASKGDVMAAAGTTLEERKIAVSGKLDWVSLSIFRGKGAQRSNNEVRDMFRKAVADMFGGENNIPGAVRDAMLLKDYGCGKPLTARRILAVKEAIDSLDRGNAFDKANDPDGKLADKAFAAGYTRLDFGKLNTAANLLAKMRHTGLHDAMEEVLEKGSAANRTMHAGSVYMKDAKSFASGYDRFQRIAGDAARNREVVELCGSEASAGGLSEVAENLAYRFGSLLNEAETLRAAAHLPEAVLASLREAADGIAEEMGQIAEGIRDKTIDGREAIYKRLFNNQNVIDLNNVVQSTVAKIPEKSRRDPAVAEFVQHIIHVAKEATVEYDKLAGAGKTAIARDMAGRAKSMLSAAANEAAMSGKGPCAIPDGIMDTIGEFLESEPFGNFKNVEQFCANLEKYGDSALRFDDAQKKELKELIDNHFGAGPKADKILKEFVDKFETSFFADQLHSPGKFGERKPANPEIVLNHFKKNPASLVAFDPGFKLDTDEDAATLKTAVANQLAAGFNKRLAEKDTFTSLSSGLMPQSVREYDVGYVTFNGRNIPNAQLGTTFPQLSADSQNPQRKGFAEFLEKTFDANHKKIRQFVSLACSMADGFGGAFDALIDEGGGNVKTKGAARRECSANGTIFVSADRLPDDNCNIEITDNGDVKITLTRRVRNKICSIVDDKGVYVPRLLRQSPDDLVTAGDVKITATMTIKNSTDAELGDAMPEFAIGDIRQEEV